MRIPDECSDETINRLWDSGPDLPTEIPRSALNMETMFTGEPPTYVIDLRRKYCFQFEQVGLFRIPQYRCIDMLTFDPDPDGTFHCIGYGETKGQAQCDLLEKIATAVAHE